MRAVQWGRAGIVVWVLGGLVACDPGVDVQSLEGEAAPLAAMPATHTGGSARVQPVDTRPFRHLGERPMQGALLDNFTCETAATLPDAGVRDVPVVAKNPRAGCAASAYGERFFKVTVQPREVLWVTIHGPSAEDNISNLWLSANAACTIPEGQCLLGDDWQQRQVGFDNPGKAAIERYVSVTAANWSQQTAFGLTVNRAPLAPNATCAAAATLQDDVHVAGAKGQVGASNSSTLFYATEVPPMTRLAVDSGGGFVAFRTDCESTPDALNGSTFTNTTPHVQRVFVDVTRYWWDAPAFDVAVDLTRLSPEASCLTPRGMVVGDVAELAVDEGAPGPEQCWCLRPERALNVTVTVPANTTVAVQGVVDDERSGAILVEMPSACADACGTNGSFGWAQTPAELVFVNDSDAAVVRNVLVSSNQTWNDLGMPEAFPSVHLSVSAHPSESE